MLEQYLKTAPQSIEGVFMEDSSRNVRYALLFIVFALVLVGFAFFSRQILFHDAPEYIANSKILAGFLDEKIDSPHSFLYPVFFVVLC